MTPADIDLESCLYSLIPSGRCSATNHLKEWAEALNPTVRNWAGILLKRARLQTRKPMRYGPVNTLTCSTSRLSRYVFFTPSFFKLSSSSPSRKQRLREVCRYHGTVNVSGIKAGPVDWILVPELWVETSSQAHLLLPA